MKLEIPEFLRRFMLHVLPHGFVRIRYYGFLSARSRGELLPVCMKLLGKEEAYCPKEKKPRWDEAIMALTGHDPLLCPQCGKARMRLRQEIPKYRSPERISLAA